MPEFISKIVEKLKTLWKETSKRDKTRFFIIAGLAFLVLIVAVSILSQTEYDVLFRDLSQAESGEVLTALDEMGVPYTVENGNKILVPKDRADTLRLQLAAQGHPSTGFNYDLYASTAGFGSTDADKRVGYRFQMQDRLQRTIEANPDISQAIVTLSEPDNSNSIFASEVRPASATVMLVMNGNATLSQEQVSSIEMVVASAVENLLPENVSITDNRLRRLNAHSATDLSVSTSQHDMELRFTQEINQNLFNLLAPIYGTNKVRVESWVDLDFDKKSSEKISFTFPAGGDEGLPVSMQTVVEKAKGTSGTAGEPGVDENGGTAIYPEIYGNNLSEYSKTTTNVNNEFDKLLEKVESEQGSVSDMSVSIVIDNQALSDDNKNADDIASLAAGVMGLTDKSKINVRFMKLDGVAAEQQAAADYAAEKQSAATTALIKQLVLYGLIAACVIVLIIRTMSLFKKKEEPKEEEPEPMPTEQAEYEELVRLATRSSAAEIEVTKSASRERVEEFIDKSPESVANLLRSWLQEESKKGGRRR